MKQLLDKIYGSRKPIFYLGNGCRHIENLDTLIKTLNAHSVPYICNSHAHGLVKDPNQANWGTFGFGAPNFSAQAIDLYEPDLIIFLGTRLREFQTNAWDKRLTRIKYKIHVDKNVSAFNKGIQVDVPLHSDIENFIDLVSEYGFESDPTRNQYLEQISTSNFRTPVPTPEPNGVHPANLMRALNQALPNNAAIISDVGNSMVWTVGNLIPREQQDFYLPLGLSSMGSGVCSSVGVKAAFPDRPVFSIVGDATMLMQGGDLFTSIVETLPIKVFVLNDGGHGMVDHGQRMVGMPVDARFPRRIDFVKWAHALSMDAYRIHQSSEVFSEEIKGSFESPRTTIYDVIIDPTIPPPIEGRAGTVAKENA